MGAMILSGARGLKEQVVVAQSIAEEERDEALPKGNQTPAGEWRTAPEGEWNWQFVRVWSHLSDRPLDSPLHNGMSEGR
jgi:hypothetical protein